MSGAWLVPQQEHPAGDVGGEIPLSTHTDTTRGSGKGTWLRVCGISRVPPAARIAGSPRQRERESSAQNPRHRTLGTESSAQNHRHRILGTESSVYPWEHGFAPAPARRSSSRAGWWGWACGGEISSTPALIECKKSCVNEEQEFPFTFTVFPRWYIRANFQNLIFFFF